MNNTSLCTICNENEADIEGVLCTQCKNEQDKLDCSEEVKMARSRKNIVRAIVDFAKLNSMIIHPAIGYDYFVDNLLLLGNCACAPERKNCPCKESKEEVLRDGKCKCGLYWRSLDYWLAYDPMDPMKKLEVEG